MQKALPELGEQKVETMFYIRNSKIRKTNSPEFLFRIAAKINVADWATVSVVIIYFLHNAVPANCQRHRIGEILIRQTRFRKRFKATDRGSNT